MSILDDNFGAITFYHFGFEYIKIIPLFINIYLIMSKTDTLNTIVDLNPVALGLNKLFSSSKLLSNISTYFAQLFANKIPIRA